MRKKKGFTLVEILVAAGVFSLVILGLLAVFASSNRIITHARERMISAQLGKLFLDPLQADVRQDTWNSNSLNVSNASVSFTNQIINSRDFSANYTVADGNPGVNYDAALNGTDLRRVITTISWDEYKHSP